MSKYRKKLPWLYLVCSIVFSVHVFLVAFMYSEITDHIDCIEEHSNCGETFEAWMYLMMALDFPLSMLIIPLDGVFQITTSLRSNLFIPVFFLLVGTLNWILLVLIAKHSGFYRHFTCRKFFFFVLSME